MKVISFQNNRAARRRAERNRQVQERAGVLPVVGLVMHIRRAIKRDGTVGPMKQIAFLADDSQENQQQGVRELLEWAYGYGSSEQSKETEIARVLSPEATVIYREVRESKDVGDWARLFLQLEKDKVTFHIEKREVEV